MGPAVVRGLGMAPCLGLPGLGDGPPKPDGVQGPPMEPLCASVYLLWVMLPPPPCSPMGIGVCCLPPPPPSIPRYSSVP